ncbi:MAG TPA: deoxyhypusine synthase [Candidatus Thermoplasmatota archaeon]
MAKGKRRARPRAERPSAPSKRRAAPAGRPRRPAARPPAVEDIEVTGAMTAADLVEQMGLAGGFTAKHVAEALGVLQAMRGDAASVNFLSFPAALMATGCRGVMRTLVDTGVFHAVVTTCGTLDHDIARSFAPYHPGSFAMDDRELLAAGVHRLGNVLVPRDSYGPLLEERLRPWFDDLYARGLRDYTSPEILREVGMRLPSTSFLATCAARSVPVFVPGLTDGAFGSQLWMYWQEHRAFRWDPMREEHELSDIVFAARRSGALMVGGGISKHHTLWWNQFKGGLDYGVFVTTASQYDGSLSGARLEEAISWGKLKPKARFVTVDGDATVMLPLLAAGLLR